MRTKLEMYYDMGIVRLLADYGVMFNDEVVREAGKQGARAGMKLRSAYINGSNNNL